MSFPFKYLSHWYQNQTLRSVLVGRLSFSLLSLFLSITFSNLIFKNNVLSFLPSFLPPHNFWGGLLWLLQKITFLLPAEMRMFEAFSDSKAHWGMEILSRLLRNKGSRGATARSVPQKGCFAWLLTRGWAYESPNSNPPLFAEPCYSKLITMLIVLIACIGAAPVCVSWLWSRIIPWLHWPFRLNFVIKTESPKGLPKLLSDPEDHPWATLCQWGPGVLLCGQPIRQTWAGSRLGSGAGQLCRQPGTAVGPGLGTARPRSPPCSLTGCCQLLTPSCSAGAANQLPTVQHSKKVLPAWELYSLWNPVLQLSCWRESGTWIQKVGCMACVEALQELWTAPLDVS